MIRHGVQPVKKDHRDYSQHRTFGSVSSFPDNVNLDAGFGFPNQDVLGYPFGCTGYTSTEVCQDEDKATYQPGYTYDKTLNMEGIFIGSPQWQSVGCDIRDSLNSTIIYGVLGEKETTDAQAESHRRGAYYNVELIAGKDWFDSIRSAIVTNKATVSIVTPWFPEWAVAPVGIVQPTDFTQSTSALSWHNWKICGWKTINGVVYLVGKTWQGTSYGDGGYSYYTREQINTLFTVSGVAAFTLAPFAGDNVKVVVLTLWQYVASYLRMLAAQVRVQ